MQKKSTSSSAFFNLRALIGLLLCAATAYFVLIPIRSGLAFLGPQGPANASQRTLTFEERVSYQRAIEDVYWRHRIWPKERPDPKPSLDAVMSQAQLEKKVADYLRKSQALQDYWQRPITPEQLQAEMDRMAKYSRQPEVLRELFEALGNDPFVIAECLARPALADRLLTSWYAYDERIHGELKHRAEAELQAQPSVAQMKQLSGTYSEIELVKRDSEETVGQAHRLPNEQLAGGAPALQRQDASHNIELNSPEWDETVQKLASAFGVRRDLAALQSADMSAHSQSAAAQLYEDIPVGKLSPLQEDEMRYYATAVIEKTDDRLKLATVSWLKQPLELWLARAENQMRDAIAVPSSSYTLAQLPSGACIEDTWTATTGPPEARDSHTAVWTGSEMIVWGGENSEMVFVNTGGRYNPSTDNWAATSITNAPGARSYHTAVWTGSEMIIWGGNEGGFFNPGGRYNPGTNSWTATSTTNAPDPRAYHTAVWTGSEMIVWGGEGDAGVFNTGGRYNPGTNSWTATSTTNAPDPRAYHTAVWTGSEMIVWGGTDFGSNFNTGGRYTPGKNRWTPTSTANAPSTRKVHTAVWTGTEMIVWGGGTLPDLNTGGRYDPTTDSWTSTNNNVPSSRAGHTAVWTGSEMIVWGGLDQSFYGLDTGAKYDPGTDSWVSTTTSNAPAARSSHTAVWTGSEIIVWGGRGQDQLPLNTGGRYNPGANSWTSTRITNAPDARHGHTAVWTGTKMIVWGGFGLFGSLDTGGTYEPSTNSWTATSTTNAPEGRNAHTAIWT